MKLSKNLFTITWIFLTALMMADLYLIFFVAPEEKMQGIVQKIFYFHVSSAFSMYFGFGLAGLGAFLYLFKRKKWMDHLSIAGGSVGLVFCSMVLVSGPLWARPIWGTYWTWDPRLTTTLILWLMFVAVSFLREFYGSKPRGSFFASILTLVAMLDMPLVFLAIKLWRGIHPQVLGEEESMPTSMLVTFIVSNITFIALFVQLVWLKLKALKLEDSILQKGETYEQ